MLARFTDIVSGFLKANDSQVKQNNWDQIASELANPEMPLTARHVGDLFLGCLREPNLGYFKRLVPLINEAGDDLAKRPQVIQGLSVVTSAFMRREMGTGRLIDRAASKLPETDLEYARRVVVRLFDDFVYDAASGQITSNTIDRVLKDSVTFSRRLQRLNEEEDLYETKLVVEGNVASVGMARPDYTKDVVAGKDSKPFAAMDLAKLVIDRFVL